MKLLKVFIDFWGTHLLNLFTAKTHLCMFPHTKLKPTIEREQITQTKNEEQRNAGKLLQNTQQTPTTPHVLEAQ